MSMWTPLFKAFRALSVVVLLAPLSLRANVSGLTVACSPCTGDPGDTITVTVTWNAGAFERAHLYVAFSEFGSTISTCATAGQTFVVTSSCSTGGACSTSSIPGGTDGYTVAADGPGSQNFSIVVPASLTPGTTYNLVATAGTYYVDCNAAGGSHHSDAPAASFTVDPPDPDHSLSLRTESASGVPDGLALYFVDYSFQASTNFVITSQVPLNSTLVSMSTGGNSAGSTPGSILSWNLGDSPGVSTGTVWFLVRLDDPLAPGSTVSASASGTTTENGAKAAGPVVVTVGASALPSLSKAQGVPSATLGDPVTYTLHWDQGDTGLQVYDHYDDNTGSPVSFDGAAYNIVGGSGSWSAAADPAGGMFITASGGGGYPLALRSVNVGYCKGYTISGDMKVDAGQPSNYDAHMVLRHDGVAGAAGRGYMLAISGDSGPYHFFIQKNGASVTYPAGSNAFVISTGQWYSVKAQLSDNGGGLRIQAKVWLRGTAEPGAWLLDYTDFAPLACASAGQYVGWQADLYTDHYDNLRVSSPAPPDAQRVYDTLPAGISYVSCTQGCTAPGGAHGSMVWWDLPAVLDGSNGDLTWTGTVNTCSDQVNVASMHSDQGWPQVQSNSVTLTVGSCFTPTISPTPTDLPTPGPSLTPTPSPSASLTPSPSYTETLTRTPTFSATPTNTPTPPATGTPTPSPTRTLTSTVTPTSQPTAEPLYLRLYPANPGPAQYRTWLPYHISTDADVDIQVWTVAGEPVRGWNAGFRTRGYHEELWDLRNEGGQGVSSGIFIYRIRAKSPAGEEQSQFGKAAVAR